MVVYDNHILVDGDSTAVDLSDTDPADILIVVDRADQHLCIGPFSDHLPEPGYSSRIVSNSGIIFFWLIVQAAESHSRPLRKHRRTGQSSCSSDASRSMNKLQNLVDDLLRPCLRTVDFIDAYDDRKDSAPAPCCSTNLVWGIASLKCIYHKDYAIYHLSRHVLPRRRSLRGQVCR